MFVGALLRSNYDLFGNDFCLKKELFFFLTNSIKVAAHFYYCTEVEKSDWMILLSYLRCFLFFVFCLRATLDLQLS